MWSSVPFDISLEIFQYLPPSDLLSLGQTCKYLENLTRERSLWQTQTSRLRSHFPKTSKPKPGTHELRKKAVAEEKIDTKWRRSFDEPRKLVPVYVHPMGEDSVDVGLVDLLPGGDWVVLILSDGALDIRPVITPPSESEPTAIWLEPFQPCHSTGERLRLSLSGVIPTSESGGQIVLSMVHDAPATCGNHLRIYEYHVHVDRVTLDFCIELSIPQDRRIYGMDKSGTLFGVLLGIEDTFYASMFDSNITPSRDAVLLNEARFHIQGFEGFAMELGLALIMQSPTRIIVGNGLRICIYDIPATLEFSIETPDTLPPSLTPIWKWEEPGFDPKNEPEFFEWSPIFYDHRGGPMLWFVAEGRCLRFLRLSSDAANPVEENRKLDTEYDIPPVLGISRALACTAVHGVTEMSTIVLDSSLEEGSFMIHTELGEEHLVDMVGFDEVSGRVSVVVMDEKGGVTVSVAL